jgi:two-component sensor histidine kinase
MTMELTADDRIREADHRIKNHLQMVASMLALQSQQSANAELREELDRAAHRVMAVALLHAQLQRNRDGEVDVAAYLEEVCRDLALSSDCEARQIQLSLAVESTVLPGDQAIALGLITSELVTNAIKHAYGGRPGIVSVKFEDYAGDWRLTVADRGPGLAPAPPEGRGFGLRLIGRLAQKLGGAFTVVSDGFGAQFRVEFPSLPETTSDMAVDAITGEAGLHLA